MLPLVVVESYLIAKWHWCYIFGLNCGSVRLSVTVYWLVLQFVRECVTPGSVRECVTPGSVSRRIWITGLGYRRKLAESAGRNLSDIRNNPNVTPTTKKTCWRSRSGGEQRPPPHHAQSFADFRRGGRTPHHGPVRGAGQSSAEF